MAKEIDCQDPSNITAKQSKLERAKAALSFVEAHGRKPSKEEFDVHVKDKKSYTKKVHSYFLP